MTTIAELLESELKAAFDVKDERSLHNYITILAESLVRKDEYMEDTGSIKSDIRAAIDSMREGFNRMDERFKAMDERFKAMDERFKTMDGRFKAIDKRFEAADKRFDDLIGQMNMRFEASDKRFDDMMHYMDKRFDDLISQTNSRFNMMFFFMSAGFTILTVLMTLYRFMG